MSTGITRECRRKHSSNERRLGVRVRLAIATMEPRQALLQFLVLRTQYSARAKGIPEGQAFTPQATIGWNKVKVMRAN